MAEESIQLDLKDLPHHVTVMEYAAMCGVSKNAVHLRQKAKKFPLEVKLVDAWRLWSQLTPEMISDLKENRDKLYAALIDAAGKKKTLKMIDTKKFPVLKRKPGRPRIVAVKNQNLVKQAHHLNFTLSTSGAGFTLTPMGGDKDSIPFESEKQVKEYLQKQLIQKSDAE